MASSLISEVESRIGEWMDIFIHNEKWATRHNIRLDGYDVRGFYNPLRYQCQYICPQQCRPILGNDIRTIIQ